MYEAHPSSALLELFRSKPHQGVAPEKAEFMFVGLETQTTLLTSSRTPSFRVCLSITKTAPPSGASTRYTTRFFCRTIPEMDVAITSRSPRSASSLSTPTSCRSSSCCTFLPSGGADWNVTTLSVHTCNGSEMQSSPAKPSTSLSPREFSGSWQAPAPSRTSQARLYRPGPCAYFSGTETELCFFTCTSPTMASSKRSSKLKPGQSRGSLSAVRPEDIRVHRTARQRRWRVPW